MFKKTLKINIVIMALVVAMGLPVLAEGTPPNSVTEAKTELQTKQNYKDYEALMQRERLKCRISHSQKETNSI